MRLTCGVAIASAARLGYIVATCNLLGSVLYTIASLCYFARCPPWNAPPPLSEWEYETSEWGVRFGYGIGSIAFVVGAVLSFPELLSDE